MPGLTAAEPSPVADLSVAMWRLLDAHVAKTDTALAKDPLGYSEHVVTIPALIHIAVFSPRSALSPPHSTDWGDAHSVLWQHPIQTWGLSESPSTASPAFDSPMCVLLVHKVHIGPVENQAVPGGDALGTTAPRTSI